MQWKGGMFGKNVVTCLSLATLIWAKMWACKEKWHSNLCRLILIIKIVFINWALEDFEWIANNYGHSTTMLYESIKWQVRLQIYTT